MKKTYAVVIIAMIAWASPSMADDMSIETIIAQSQGLEQAIVRESQD